MSDNQPHPLVVIRNQLLAFLVLNLLGSCVPSKTIQTTTVDVASYNSRAVTAKKVSSNPPNVIISQPHSR